MSSSPHLRPIASNTASSCPGAATSSGMKIGASSSLRERLDVGPGLLVDVGDRELRARARGTPSRSRRRSSARWRCRRRAPCCPCSARAGNVQSSSSTSFQSGAEHAPRVARDHQLLVGRDHPRRRRGSSAVLMRGPLRCVRARRRARRRATPHRAQTRSRRRGAVLADAGGEHDRVEPAERRRERAELAPDPVDEEIDRGLRRAGRCSPRASACRSRCPTRRAARTAGRCSFSIARASMPQLVHQVEHHAGIEAAAARAHRQAVDRGEAHRARDALARLRSRTCWRRCRDAARPSCPRAARASYCGSTLRDVLVGQAVEAVAPHAALGDRLRQRERLRDRRLRAVERGVEARDLRQLAARARAAPGSARDCAAGAAARAERASRASASTAASTRTGCGVVRAAVDDAVADADQPVLARAASRRNATR